MFFGIILVFLFGGLLAVIARAIPHAATRTVLGVILGGYALRFALSPVVRNVAFFSHAAGGDSMEYEQWAQFIVRIWNRVGVHFVSSTELPMLGATSLPPNLFAMIYYVGGPGAHIGCLAVVAFAAGLLSLNVFSLAVELGALPRTASRLMTLLYLSPVFVFYTCDTYKDGLVAFLVVGALASAIRLSRRFSLLHACLGAASLFALWYVRFYLVFVTSAPFFVGIVGFGSKSLYRPVLLALGFLAGAIALVAFTDILQSTLEHANATFENGTSQNVLAANAAGGSGVTFDDNGNPLGDLGPKLLYTIFSPFPWAGGSVGFQIGKLDAFLWYFVIYRSYQAARQVWRTQPATVLMLLTFLVPCTFMYATSVSNVGLIVRQRLIIVIIGFVFASLYKPEGERAATDEEAGEGDASPPPPDDGSPSTLAADA